MLSGSPGVKPNPEQGFVINNDANRSAAAELSRAMYSTIF